MTISVQRLEDNYARVEDQVREACRMAGRGRQDVRLIAVSKFHPASAIAAVARLGQKDFGENYVQEALEKMTGLASQEIMGNARWHMIGHVQSRKAHLIAGKFDLVHTLDSQKLADAFEKKLAQLGIRQTMLVEVNIGAEPQKSGIMPDEVPGLAEHVMRNCPHISLRGLMCLPPVFDNGDASRPYFARLRQIRDKLAADTGSELPELSMGMSGDFSAAIAEGATIVRIGTGIFGVRPQNQGSR